MKILIVDDHPVVISGCKALLAEEKDIEVFSAADAETGYAAFFAQEADIGVIDINLPGVSGFQLMRRILLRKPEAPIVIFSMNDDPAFAARALQEGAKGFIPKSDDPMLFVAALREIFAGGVYLPHYLAQKIAFAKLEDPVSTLSTREMEIMRLLGAGNDTGAIADKLGVSSKTISNNLTNLKGKFGARSAMELLRAAMEMTSSTKS